MNAVASSSKSTLACLASRRVMQSARGSSPLRILAPTVAVSRSTSWNGSMRSVYSTSALNTPPSARPTASAELRRAFGLLQPVLLGSPSNYLVGRALRSGSLKSYSTTPQSPATSIPKPSPPSPNQSQNHSESDPDPDSDPDADTPPNASAYTRLKLLFKRYGWYALGMYTVLSALDFTLVFVLIHLAGAERIEPLFMAMMSKYRVIRYGDERAKEIETEVKEEKRVEALEQVKDKKKNKGWMSRTVLAELALAYPIHKVALLPVRAGLTVAWTPKFVGWLTRRGWVGKGGYTRAASHAQDKIRTAKDRVKERVQDLKQP